MSVEQKWALFLLTRKPCFFPTEGEVVADKRRRDGDDIWRRIEALRAARVN